MKNTQKALECQKKKQINVIPPEDFKELEKQLTESVLENCCFEKFEEISGKTSVAVYSFLFY